MVPVVEVEAVLYIHTYLCYARRQCYNATVLHASNHRTVLVAGTIVAIAVTIATGLEQWPDRNNE